MHNQAKEIIYVGKAKNLRKRVSSYFNRKTSHDNKTSALVSQIQHVETIVTHSENDALLLENTLIKQHHPRYNVLLRDDKSYPYLLISTDHPYPQLLMRRGRPTGKGRYFGPFVSSYAVRETLDLLQRAFKLRDCRNSVFNNRSRPCLQHQIKRCSAPCVNFIAQQAYKENVSQVIRFLEGKSFEVIDQLADKMQQHAQACEFEQAAVLRDQITCLKQIQRKQHVVQDAGDFEVFCITSALGRASIARMSVRQGHVMQNQLYQANLKQLMSTEAEVLASTISQHYLSGDQAIPPGKSMAILTNIVPENAAWLSNALSALLNRNIKIQQARGKQKAWVEMATENAALQHVAKSMDPKHYLSRLESLKNCLSMDALPSLMHCIDISHTMGKFTIASCVAFDDESPKPAKYRYFNLSLENKGDDVAAIYQAVLKRYKDAKQYLPDVLVIDGAKPQLNAAVEALQTLKRGSSSLVLLAIAKGPGRDANFDKIYRYTQGDFQLVKPAQDALLMLQHLRDEAHRFAINRHRKKRGKMSLASFLETIDGIGPKKRQELLNHFASLEGIKSASVDDIASLPGFSRNLAQFVLQSLDKS